MMRDAIDMQIPFSSSMEENLDAAIDSLEAEEEEEAASN
jgi:hypothetical protein